MDVTLYEVSRQLQQFNPHHVYIIQSLLLVLSSWLWNIE